VVTGGRLERLPDGGTSEGAEEGEFGDGAGADGEAPDCAGAEDGTAEGGPVGGVEGAAGAALSGPRGPSFDPS
jgi:hypothetical protein